MRGQKPLEEVFCPQNVLRKVLWRGPESEAPGVSSQVKAAVLCLSGVMFVDEE